MSNSNAYYLKFYGILIILGTDSAIIKKDELNVIMVKKFRRHGRTKISTAKELKSISRKVTLQNAKQITRQYYLTTKDRITSSYKILQNKEVVEITCVSYELQVDNDWKTLVYFDTYHAGIMHRHLKLYLEKDLEDVNNKNIKQTGILNNLLTWANKTLRRTYLDYKQGFIKRNKQYLKKHNIDLY